MAGRPPDHCSSSAFGPRSERDDIANRLCGDVFRSVLFSDHHSGLRHMAPSSASEAPRQLQIMEGLLAPFLGTSAPRIAKAVRNEFGTLGRALRASDMDFAKLGPDGRNLKALLVAACELVDGVRNERAVSARLDPADRQLHIFLRRRLCATAVEKLMIMFCDGRGHYLGDEVIACGTRNGVELDMQSLFRQALSIGASSFLMAHNHPSGVCSPSDNDIRATKRVAHAAPMLGLSVLDHLIITSGECYSMRTGGLL